MTPPSSALVSISWWWAATAGGASIQTPHRRPELCSGMHAALPCLVTMCHSMRRCRRTPVCEEVCSPPRRTAYGARQLACFKGHRSEGLSHGRGQYQEIGNCLRCAICQAQSAPSIPSGVPFHPRQSPWRLGADGLRLHGTHTEARWPLLFLRGNQACRPLYPFSPSTRPAS